MARHKCAIKLRPEFEFKREGDNALKYDFGFRKQLKLSATRIYVSKLNKHVGTLGVFILEDNFLKEFCFLLWCTPPKSKYLKTF